MDFLKTLLQRAPADALLLDVGANEGGYTHLFRQHRPGAAIHAFEPIPVLCRQTQQRFATDERICVWPVGISDRSYVAEGLAVHEAWTLDTPEHAVRGRNALSIERDGPGTLPPIPFTTLDHFLVKWPDWGTDPACIKIDTDGYEYRVLLGAQETLRRARPTILIEVGYLVEDMGDAIPLLLHLIYAELGYVLVEQDGTVWPTAQIAAERYPYHTTHDVAMIPAELSTQLEFLD